MLNSTYPVWTSVNRPPKQYPWLSEDISCEVCVVGGGIGGAVCAMRLAEAGCDTVLITENRIGAGATAKSMPCCEYDLGVTAASLERRGGGALFPKLLRKGMRALAELRALSEDCGEYFGFRLTDQLIFTEHPEELELLRREYETRLDAGADVVWIDGETAAEAFSLPVPGGILSKNLAAVFDPYLLAHACAARAERLGARVYENTGAVSLDPGGSKLLELTTFHTVLADQVVLTVGADAAEFSDGDLWRRTAFMTAGEPSGHLGLPGSVMRTFSEPSVTFALSPDGRPCAGGLCTSFIDENGKIGGVRAHGLYNRRLNELEREAKAVYGLADDPFPFACAACYAGFADCIPAPGASLSDSGFINAPAPAPNGALYAMIAARRTVSLWREMAAVKISS